MENSIGVMLMSCGDGKVTAFERKWVGGSQIRFRRANAWYLSIQG